MTVGSATCGEQLEPVGESFDDLVGRELCDLRGGELDGQRDAVEPPADLGDVGRVGLGHHEIGAYRDGAVAEQAHRVRKLGQIGRVIRRHGKRRDRADLFALQLERFTAGRQDGDVRAPVEDRVDEVRAGVDQMLAVVENEEHFPGREEVDELLRGTAGLGSERQAREAHGGGCDPAHGTGIGDRRQVREEDPVREPFELAARCFDGESRLSTAADADERDQMIRREMPPNRGEVCIPADEVRALRRQVVSHAEGSQRREVETQVVVVELEHALGSGNVAQAVEPEVAQRDARREAGEARFGRFRADDLAAMGRRAQTSATIRRGAVVVVAS